MNLQMPHLSTAKPGTAKLMVNPCSGTDRAQALAMRGKIAGLRRGVGDGARGLRHIDQSGHPPVGDFDSARGAHQSRGTQSPLAPAYSTSSRKGRRWREWRFSEWSNAATHIKTPVLSP